VVQVLPDDWNSGIGGHVRVLVGHQFEARDGAREPQTGPRVDTKGILKSGKFRFR
jgi:hypothetical protein